MPERKGNANLYRYGAGGQEKVDEISGLGNHYTAEYWEMDPRLGRRWNIDPVVKPWQSGYSILGNNPIYFTDPLGNTETKYEDEDGKLIKDVKDGKDERVTVNREQFEKALELAKENNLDIDNKQEDAAKFTQVYERISITTGAQFTRVNTLDELTVTPSNKQNTSSGWYATSSFINGLIGLKGSALEATPGSFRIGTSKYPLSPKFYLSSWRGNQYTTTYNMSKIGKGIGYGTFVIGVGFDIVGVFNYYQNGPNDPNAVHPAKAATNTGVGAYALYINPVVGIVYFGLDSFYPGGIK